MTNHARPTAPAPPIYLRVNGTRSEHATRDFMNLAEAHAMADRLRAAGLNVRVMTDDNSRLPTRR